MNSKLTVDLKVSEITYVSLGRVAMIDQRPLVEGV